jgi:hypothetical protein
MAVSIGPALVSIFTIVVLPQKAWKPMVGFGCAVILWVAVLWALVY